MWLSIKQVLKTIVLRNGSLRRPAVAYCAENGLLPRVFVRTPPAQLREFLLLPHSSHETQLNQDIFGLLVNRYQPGFFLEIGANDGYTLSNTLYLEEQFGWDGILVEANPRYAKSLENRKAQSVISAVTDSEGRHRFRDAGLYGGLAGSLGDTHSQHTEPSGEIDVWGTTLERILESNRAPKRIDFVSIDVEGAEAMVVRQMTQLDQYRFVCGCIEHNARTRDYDEIRKRLDECGYAIVWEGQTNHDLFFVDRHHLSLDRARERA